MPRKSKSPRSEPTLPSRQDLVAFVANAPGKVGKREIARAFNIQGGDRLWLKETLKELESEGALDRRKQGDPQARQAPPRRRRRREVPRPRRRADCRAGGMGRRARAGAEDPGRRCRGNRGPACRCQASATARSSGPSRSARSAGAIPAASSRSSASIRRRSSASSAPCRTAAGASCRSRRSRAGGEIAIAPGDEGEAEDGDLVAATTSKQGRYGLPQAKVRERLGSVRSEKAVSLIAIHAHSIPHVFPPEVVKRGRGRGAGRTLRPGGLARAAARHHRSGRRQGP